MPKKIENLETLLAEEAMRQIRENGYCAVTIRSIAKAVGVGVGTVYNYFPSKDALLAKYMLNDWKQCVALIGETGERSASVEHVVRCIYDQLCGFALRHASIIHDKGASSVFAGSFSQYHGLLRSQLAQPLGRFCHSAFASEFIAEALLTWTMAGKEFDEIYGMIEKLF